MGSRFTSQKVLSSLWFVPVLCVLAGMVLSFVTIVFDRATDYDLVPRSLTGGADAALAILSTIAASMVSLAALVLTITMVVVQLAMGQFSPRIVQTILQDKPSQFAIGLFVATFAHAMLTLREVQFGPPEVVPGLAIIAAYILVVVSIVVLVMYVHHIGRSLRVSALIELVGTDTRRLLDEQYPAPPGDPDPSPDEQGPARVVAPNSGVVIRVDQDGLVELAAEAGCVLRMRPSLGEFVPAGAVLFDVEGDAGRLDHDAAAGAIRVGLERTLEQDIAYGFRLLVDIAERSVSESPFQDPTTAVQAIDRLHDCLRQLAPREFPDGIHRDDGGAVRLIMPVMDWDAYVELAFEEIRLVGAASPQVARRMRAALEDLRTVAPTERRPALDRELRLLREAVDGATDHGSAFDLTGDALGIGTGSGPAPA